MKLLSDREILTVLLGYSDEQADRIIDKLREEDILSIYTVLASDSLGDKDETSD